MNYKCTRVYRALQWHRSIYKFHINSKITQTILTQSFYIQGWHLIWNIIYFSNIHQIPPPPIVLQCFFGRKSFLPRVYSHLAPYLVHSYVVFSILWKLSSGTNNSTQNRATNRFLSYIFKFNISTRKNNEELRVSYCPWILRSSAYDVH